jgi:hypothetical protein
MLDAIMDCAQTAADHDEFVACVSHLANEWMLAGLIIRRDRGMIQACAGQAELP